MVQGPSFYNGGQAYPSSAAAAAAAAAVLSQPYPSEFLFKSLLFSCQHSNNNNNNLFEIYALFNKFIHYFVYLPSVN